MWPIVFFLVYVFLGMIFIKIMDIDYIEQEPNEEYGELDLTAYTILVTLWPIACVIATVITVKNYFESWW